MRRYFLSPVIGTGTFEDPFRLKTNGADYAAIVPTDAVGAPRFAYGLLIAEAGSLATLLADVTLSAFPDMQLSDTITGAQATQLSAAVLSRLGVVLTFSAGDTFADVLRAIGRLLDPTFSERNFARGV